VSTLLVKHADVLITIIFTRRWRVVSRRTPSSSTGRLPCIRS